MNNTEEDLNNYENLKNQIANQVTRILSCIDYFINCYKSNEPDNNWKINLGYLFTEYSYLNRKIEEIKTFNLKPYTKISNERDRIIKIEKSIGEIFNKPRENPEGLATNIAHLNELKGLLIQLLQASETKKSIFSKVFNFLRRFSSPPQKKVPVSP